MDHDQEVSVPAKSRYKTKTPRIYRVGFYLVHFLLICTASLPTVFFVYHRYRLEHTNESRKSPDSTARSNLFNIDQNGLYSSTNQSQNESATAVPRCHAPLVYSNLTNDCYAPCEWSTMSTRTHRVYFILMVVGLWLPLFSTIFILITWLKLQSLRIFPHVVRFYIVICCILLACCKMLPLRIGLKKAFCVETERWDPSGMKSMTITIQGASCHYLTLCLCFWATCFIANTYLVVVKGTRKLFVSSILIHLIQSLLCWVVPAIIVAICFYVKYPSPAYNIVFVDFMTAGPCGEVLKYLAVTLPMEITLGVSLCLLWSITWCIRRSRLDNTKHAIRADKETQSMLRIERQFTSMKVIIVLVVGVMLSITTIKDYQLEMLVNSVKLYFDCLKSTDKCQQPNLLTPLYAVIIVLPGFLCMVFFFLLFMNKDCREIWTSFFQRLCRLRNLTKPRSDTTKSRCSSTLTVLADRRLSDFLPRKDRVTQLKSSSTPDLIGAGLNGRSRPSPLAFKKKTCLSPLAALESRPRSSSTPVRFLIRDDNSEVGAAARVTSIPQEMGKTRRPSQSNFDIEIKVISDGDCVTDNQKRSTSCVTDNQRDMDCVTDNNQRTDCVTQSLPHSLCETESAITSNTCFDSNYDQKEIISGTIPGCICDCTTNQDHIKNSPSHVKDDVTDCGAGDHIMDNPDEYNTSHVEDDVTDCGAGDHIMDNPDEYNTSHVEDGVTDCVAGDHIMDNPDEYNTSHVKDDVTDCGAGDHIMDNPDEYNTSHVKDDVTDCGAGDHIMDNPDEYNTSHVKDDVTDCGAGYHIMDNPDEYNTSHVKDDVTDCGAGDHIMDNPDEYNTSHVKDDVTDCGAGDHIMDNPDEYNTSHVKDDVTDCGAGDHIMDNPDEYNTSHVKDDVTDCGAGDHIMDNPDEYNTSHVKDDVTDCGAGDHIMDNPDEYNTSHVKDDVTDCGAGDHIMDNPDEYNTSHVKDDVTDCGAGDHIMDNPDEYNTSHVEDDVTDCGAGDHIMDNPDEYNTSHVEDGVTDCVAGDHIMDNPDEYNTSHVKDDVTDCGAGDHIMDNPDEYNTSHVKDDVTDCGAGDHIMDNPDEYNTSHVKDDVTDCGAGYHIMDNPDEYNTSHVKDDVTDCGAGDHIMDNPDEYNTSHVEDDVTDCGAGYHIMDNPDEYNTSHVEDDVTDCGAGYHIMDNPDEYNTRL